MDDLVYLVGAAAPVVLVVIRLHRRRHLIKTVITYGCIGGVVLMFCDYFFYEHDYWHPTSLLNTSPSIADFLFGFGITSFPLIIYPCLAHQYFVRSNSHRHIGIFAIFAVLSIGSLSIGSRILHIDSILISIVLLTFFTMIICAMRTDLVSPAFCAISILTVITIPLYLLLFLVIAPSWWRQHWLLSNSSLGIMIFGHVPLLEVLCYPAWAGVAATGHPFLLGHRLSPHRER